MKIKNIKLDDIDLFIFDSDGVLTDNKVYLDQKENREIPFEVKLHIKD